MKTTAWAIAALIASIVAAAFAPAAAHAQDSWTDAFSFKGDIRLRYEGIDVDGEEERHRGRFRARLGLTADVNENVKAVVQLATGGDNPVSTNQTFDGGFSRKDIRLDLAYVDWTPNDELHVYAGKMKNPFHRAGSHALIWDSDLNPEGVAASFATGGFFSKAGVMFVEERSVSSDSLLFGLQAGYEFALSDGASLTAGVSYYEYTETKGNFPFYDLRPRGNTVDIDGRLVFDYNQVEAFTELSTTIGDLPFSVFADFVQNSEVDSQDTGYAFGAAIGKAGSPGTWQASVAWQDLEADAVIGTFTDSDFGGGGTDASGFTIKGKYALADNWAFGGTLFLNDVRDVVDNEHDYSRIQIDLEFKF